MATQTTTAPESASAREKLMDLSSIAVFEQEENKLPPVLALGYSGDKCVYYSRIHRKAFMFKPGEHRALSLSALAPRQNLEKWLFPDRGDEDSPTDKDLYENMAHRLLDDSGQAPAFAYDTLRGAGCWGTDEGIIYHAGEACYLCAPGGTPRPCSNIRRSAGGRVTIYEKRPALPLPASESLTDEEGRAILELFQARAWVHDWQADVLAGWIVCAILGASMPFRPHAWINAPSNTGKTELKNAISRVLGGLLAELESANSTEAACRSMLANGTRPVVVDEADAPGDESRQAQNLSALVGLARSATCGGVIRKGTPDGGTKEYLMASPFLFFSIRNILHREEDMNRFSILEMQQLPPGDKLNALCRRWKEALDTVTAPGYTGKLLTRALTNAARMRRLAEELAEHIRAQDVASRTAEYTAYVMAGAWVLTHSEEMTDNHRARAVEVAVALSSAVQEDNEAQAAMLRLLGYRPNNGSRTVEQLARAATIGSPEEKRRAADELGACKIEVGTFKGTGAEKGDLYLKVTNSSPDVKKAFEKTPWGVGRGALGQTLERLPGVIYTKAKLWGGTARVIMIPRSYWNGEEAPPQP